MLQNLYKNTLLILSCCILQLSNDVGPIQQYSRKGRSWTCILHRLWTSSDGRESVAVVVITIISSFFFFVSDIELFVGCGIDFQWKYEILSKKYATYPIPMKKASNETTTPDEEDQEQEVLEWTEYCKSLQDVLCNKEVTSIVIMFCWPCEYQEVHDRRRIVNDIKVTILLNCFPNLRKLNITRMPSTLQETMKLIGTTHSKIESLNILASSRTALSLITPTTILGLPGLLEIRIDLSTSSRNYHLHHYGCIEDFGDPNWLDVLECLRKKQTLECIDMLVGLRCGIDLDFWPRINQAKKILYNGAVDKNNFEDSPISFDDWIDALESVKDRFDCYHYIFTLMVPFAFSPAVPYFNEREDDFVSLLRLLVLL